MSQSSRRESGCCGLDIALPIIRREWAAKLHKYRFTSAVERPFVVVSAKSQLLISGTA
jgi:hypothetical protein